MSLRLCLPLHLRRVTAARWTWTRASLEKTEFILDRRKLKGGKQLVAMNVCRQLVGSGWQKHNRCYSALLCVCFFHLWFLFVLNHSQHNTWQKSTTTENITAHSVWRRAIQWSFERNAELVAWQSCRAPLFNLFCFKARQIHLWFPDKCAIYTQVKKNSFSKCLSATETLTVWCGNEIICCASEDHARTQR